jgi:hypothetical protein
MTPTWFAKTRTRYVITQLALWLSVIAIAYVADRVLLEPWPTIVAMVLGVGIGVVSAHLWRERRTWRQRQINLDPTNMTLIGGPGWQKGVLDCIDVLYARSRNIHSSIAADPNHGTNRGVDFADAIELLEALYKREVARG